MTALAQTVATEHRFKKNNRCPICGGADGDKRGKGRRCHGFLSGDGYAHCTREEHAGPLPQEKQGTYAHRLEGACKCGATHGSGDSWPVDIECTYDYRDEKGSLLFQVLRKIPKSFPQRRPDGAGGWIWNLAGVRRVLYQLPALIRAAASETVWLVEGEKDVDRLRSLGAVATCNPQGAKNWGTVAEHAASILRGRHVTIVVDADQDGREWAKGVAEWAKDVAATYRVLELYSDDSKRDVSDWLDEEGHSFAGLQQAAASVDAIETGIVADPWRDELAKALADVKAKLEASQSGTRDPLFGLDAAELLTMDFPATQWQVTGLITRGGVTVVAGEPKAATKTWMLIEGAIAIATGTRAFGEFPATHGRVSIFFAEDPKQPARNRVRALLNGADRTLPPGRLFLEPRGTFIDILKDEDLAWIVASVRRRGQLDLVVLDPLRDIHSGEEDKSDSMRDVMRRLRVLAELLGCTVWVSHHQAKQSKDVKSRRVGQGMRGSSAIHGAIDSGLYVEPLETDGTNKFKARVTSQVKSGRSAGMFDLELAITDDENGEAVCATWVYSRPEKKQDAPTKDEAKADAEAVLDAKMLAFIRVRCDAGESLSPTEYRNRKDRPIPEKKVVASIRRLLDTGAITTEAGQVCCPGARGNANA